MLPGSLIDLIQSIEWIKLQTKYGIEVPASTRIVQVEAVKIGKKFNYINSLLEKETHDTIC
jgi:hypothetical protein